VSAAPGDFALVLDVEMAVPALIKPGWAASTSSPVAIAQAPFKLTPIDRDS
jgi:hypothetical protein